jgi:nucleotide-binding universal stress UspA family protein
MTIRKIHVPLIGHHGTKELKAGSETALRVGLALGRKFNAHVEACCIAVVWQDPDELLAAAFPETAIEALLSEIQRRNKKGFWLTRSLFNRLAAEFRPGHGNESHKGPTFSAEFVEIADDLEKVASERGKMADLSVIASAPKAQVEHYDQLLGALLTGTGRPLLVVPVDAASVDFAKVAIAWNDTTESTRAVAMAMDFISQASEVVIVTVLEDGPLPSGPRSLAEYLRWHGVEAQVIEVEESDKGVAADLLRQCQELEADLLVMGAYTREKLKRIIFGGATDGVLAAASLPLLLID